MQRALFTDGFSRPILGKTLGVYRNKNLKAIDNKTIENVSFKFKSSQFNLKTLKFQFIYFINIPEGDSVCGIVHDVFVHVIRPVLAATKDYGNCSIQQKREFVYGIDSFIKFMKSKKYFKF